MVLVLSLNESFESNIALHISAVDWAYSFF